MSRHDIATQAQAITLRVSGIGNEEIFRQTGIEPETVGRMLNGAIARGFDPRSQHPVIRDCFIQNSRNKERRNKNSSQSSRSRERIGEREWQVWREPPLASARYSKALALLSPTFPRLKDTLKGVIMLRTADNLIRDDVCSFLADDLPLWDGPWADSSLPKVPYGGSDLSRLVSISRRADYLEQWASTEAISLRFHRVLQYQLYSQYEKDIVAAKLQKSKGERNTSLAIERFLANLHANDWEYIDQEEKKARRDRFHNQKTIGKRLQLLCDSLGYGVLLLGSRSSLRSLMKQFNEWMMEPFLCYLLNTYPELPGLMKTLSKAGRDILEGQKINMIVSNIDCIPAFEKFLQSRQGRFLPESYQRVDQGSLTNIPRDSDRFAPNEHPSNGMAAQS